MLRAVSETLLASDEPDSPFKQFDPVAAVEGFFDGASTLLRTSHRLTLWTLELSPLFWGFGFRRLTSLAGPDRESYLRKWEKTRRWTVRNVFFTLKVLVLTLAYDEPAIAREVCRSR